MEEWCDIHCRIGTEVDLAASFITLVAYQPIDDISTGLLKRPSTSANLRDLDPKKELHLN